MTSLVIHCSAYHPVIYHVNAEDTRKADFWGVQRKPSDFHCTYESEIAGLKVRKQKFKGH